MSLFEQTGATGSEALAIVSGLKSGDSPRGFQKAGLKDSSLVNRGPMDIQQAQDLRIGLPF